MKTRALTSQLHALARRTSSRHLKRETSTRSDAPRPGMLPACRFLAALCFGGSSALHAAPCGQFECFRETVFCGTNEGEIEWRLRVPASSSPTDALPRVLAFYGSPGTSFFGDNPAHAPLIDGLSQDHRIIELRYLSPAVSCEAIPGDGRRATGFYSLCCGQGTPAILDLAADNYDSAMEILEAEGGPNTTPARVLGIGNRLGTHTTEFMAFGRNREFTKIANAGITTGNVYEGCRQVNEFPNGIAYDPKGVISRDFTTISRDACTDVSNGIYNPEIRLNFGFGSYPHVDNPVVLGLFEGRNVNAYGLVPQAELIKSARDDALLPAEKTQEYYYDGCGHDVYANCPGAVYDALNFLRAP